MPENPTEAKSEPPGPSRILQAAENLLFHGGAAGKNLQIARPLCTAAFFLLGTFHWIVFFNFGRFAFTPYDWPKERVYLGILRRAILEAQLPLATNISYQGTRQFMGNPEVILTPDILLLPHMSFRWFVVVHTLIFFTIGFIGSLLLWRKYRLSLFAFSLFFFLFNFNGYITSHLAAGHYQWTGYFGLPLFALIVMHWIERPPGSVRDVKPALWMSLLMALLFLNGSFHVVVWCFLFLLILAMVSAPTRMRFLMSAGLTFLLASHRIVPAAISLWGDRRSFITGFPTVMDLVDGLVRLRTHEYAPRSGVHGSQLRWCEFDVFIGVIGLFILIYGVVLQFRRTEDTHRFRPLYAPIGGMTFLSLGRVYGVIGGLPVPLFNSEIVSSRFIAVPLLFTLLISIVNLDEGLRRLGWKRWVIWIGATILMVQEMLVHSADWAMFTMDKAFPWQSPPEIRLEEAGGVLYPMSVQILTPVSCVLVVAAILYCLHGGRPAGPACQDVLPTQAGG